MAKKAKRTLDCPGSRRAIDSFSDYIAQLESDMRDRYAEDLTALQIHGKSARVYIEDTDVFMGEALEEIKGIKIPFMNEWNNY